METNLLYTGIIACGGVLLGAITISLILFPLVTRRELGVFKFSFWGTGLVGISLSTTYIVFALTQWNDLEALAAEVGYCVLAAIACMILFSVSVTWRIYIAQTLNNWAESKARSKDDRKRLEER